MFLMEGMYTFCKIYLLLLLILSNLDAIELFKFLLA